VKGWVWMLRSFGIRRALGYWKEGRRRGWMEEGQARAWLEEKVEDEIQLSYGGSERLAVVWATSSVDAEGRTYVERMREKARRAREGRRG
jgi:hypothetical protein